MKKSEIVIDETIILSEDIEDAALLKLAGHEVIWIYIDASDSTSCPRVFFELDRESNDQLRQTMRGRTLADVIEELAHQIHKKHPMEVRQAFEFEFHDGKQKFYVFARPHQITAGRKFNKRYHPA